MKTKHIIVCAGVAILALVAVVAWAFAPRISSLPGGYTSTYFPAGGHRYISAPGGIKKVGQEVLSYQVQGAVVSGNVRLQLGGSDVRTFRLDTATHRVTLGD
jgi:hypothetical protein